jgi:hypothetical protein
LAIIFPLSSVVFSFPEQAFVDFHDLPYATNRLEISYDSVDTDLPTKTAPIAGRVGRKSRVL